MPEVLIGLASENRQNRLARLRKAAQERMQVVRVEPAGIEGRWTEEDMRRLLKHPTSGMGFPPEGSAEWPNDAFTQRRIADGSVKIAADDPSQEAKSEERRPARRGFATQQSE